MSTASIKSYEMMQRQKAQAAGKKYVACKKIEKAAEAKLAELDSEEYINKRYGSKENRQQTSEMLNSMRQAGIMTQGKMGDDTKVRGKDGKEISIIEHLQEQGLLEKGKQYSDKEREEIYKNIPHEYLITIMRRMMYRISERVARRNNQLYSKNPVYIRHYNERGRPNV